jgi:hypothetical protein
MQRLKLAFAAGDVGGARAILPVAGLAHKIGHQVSGMRHGPFFAEAPMAWTWDTPARFMDPEFWPDGPDALIYATSVADFAAIDAARVAREAGCPLIHVLDNWSSYKHRLATSDGLELVPDCYAVMDDIAKTDALAGGVPGRVLQITGHPGLAKLVDEASRFGTNRTGEVLRVLFVSEPALTDSGGPQASGWRGYDEVEVSRLVATKLGLLAKVNPAIAIRIAVAPHPREDRGEVAARWAHLCNEHLLDYELVEPDHVRATLHGADCVLGMTSILLYEAWLLGIPVLSLQPRLRRADLAALSKREGLLFCTDAPLAGQQIELLLGKAREPRRGNGELAVHAGAAQTILNIAAGLAKRFDRTARKEQDSVKCQ